jgi:hypothetical protein
MIGHAPTNLRASRAELEEEQRQMLHQEWLQAVARNLRVACLLSGDEPRLLLTISAAVAGVVRTSPGQRSRPAV